MLRGAEPGSSGTLDRRACNMHAPLNIPLFIPRDFPPRRPRYGYSNTGEEGEGGYTCSPVTYYSWNRRSKFKILDASGE